MIHQMYSVYDAKAATFQSPWFSMNNGTALRSFMEACEDKNTILNRFPDDFMLMNIGTFDDQEGVVTSTKAVSLGTARSFMKPVLNSVNNVASTNGVEALEVK
jgi:hypothetical protein